MDLLSVYLLLCLLETKITRSDKEASIKIKETPSHDLLSQDKSVSERLKTICWGGVMSHFCFLF